MTRSRPARRDLHDDPSALPEGGALIDRATLARAVGGTSIRMCQVLTIFVEEIERDLTALGAARSLKDWTAAAHGLKNSAAGAAVPRLTALADELQSLSQDDWTARRSEAEAALVQLAESASCEARRILDRKQSDHDTRR